MELRDIEYFAVLAEHGHFGRAAAALGITQPAVTLQVRALESACAMNLFRRHGAQIGILFLSGSARGRRLFDIFRVPRPQALDKLR